MPSRGPEYADPFTKRRRPILLDAFIAVLCLGLILAIIWPLLFQFKGNRERRDLAYAKLLDLSLMQFANDYHNSTPDMRDPNAFKSMLMPYVKTPSPFIDPVSHQPYIPNALLSHIDLDKLKNPDKTILIYSPERPNSNWRVVGYADGHVMVLTEDKFQDLLTHGETPTYAMGPLVGTWKSGNTTLKLDQNGEAVLTENGKQTKGEVEYNGLDRLIGRIGNQPLTGEVQWESIDSFKLIPQTGQPVIYNRRQ